MTHNNKKHKESSLGPSKPLAPLVEPFVRVQSEVEGGDEFEEMSHVDHVPQQWLPPYDGTSLRAGSLASASSLSISISDTSDASTRGSARGLGTVLIGRNRLPGNCRYVSMLAQHGRPLSVSAVPPTITESKVDLQEK